MFWAGKCVKGRWIFKGVQGLVFTVGEWNPSELVRLIDVKSEVGFVELSLLE